MKAGFYFQPGLGAEGTGWEPGSAFLLPPAVVLPAAPRPQAEAGLLWAIRRWREREVKCLAQGRAGQAWEVGA